MTKPWRGIFVIVVTPFTESYEIDEESLRKEIRFCIEAGAQGLVGPANASEFPTMSDDERKRWLEIVIDEAGGQIPVVATTTHGHLVPAVQLSKWAQDAGANGLMAMPPHILHPDAAGCYEYFKAINEAVNIPICVQNYAGVVGTPMNNTLLARMCRELEHVEYIKEETLPEPQQISRTIEAAGNACKGVFGGQGGVYLIDEWRRGAAGNMPASQLTDIQVKMWDLLEQGDEAAARKIFNRVLPLFLFERMHGVAAYKEIFYRRGIFKTRVSRAPGKTLDKWDIAEVDAVWPDIEPLFSL